MKYVYECSILLVDDNPQLQDMICNMLHKEGFSQIDTASCCTDALLYFSGQKPDIVILDIGLPDGDGFSLMQKIRSISDIPVLFLSARDEDNDRLLGLGLGADDYITKPFDRDELSARVEAVLRRCRGKQRDLYSQNGQFQRCLYPLRRRHGASVDGKRTGPFEKTGGKPGKYRYL